MSNLREHKYVKKHSKVLFTMFTSVFLMCFISSCFFPEEFTAKITINKDGTYSLVYDGILTFVPAKAEEVRQGKLTPDIEEEMKECEKEMLKDPHAKKVNYVGHGRFKVYYEEKGTLKSPVYFLNPDTSNFISIKPISDQRVSIKSMKLEESDIAQLQELKIKIDGALEVTTNARVIEHNCKNVSLWGTYKWQIKSVNNPAPHMLIHLGELNIQEKN